MSAPRRRLWWLPAPAVGVLTFTVMLVVLLFWGLLLFVPVAVLKLLMPSTATRARLSAVMQAIATAWVGSNRHIFRALHGPRGNVRLRGEIGMDKSWLVISNHQSWADILILFDVLHGRAVLPRFFLKRELIWVPLIGLICWALDMPFLTRAGKRGPAANPALAKRDLETTRRFCEKYRGRAITVVNYVEGTRCTEAKRLARRSPYRHLLAPKAGGLAFTLGVMGEQFAGLIDVTMVYQPTGNDRSLLWSFLCGEQREVNVDVVAEALPSDWLAGTAADTAAFRSHIQQQLAARWAEKDARIEARQAAPIPVVEIVAA